jgi:type IV pilus assembly protein PilO
MALKDLKFENLPPLIQAAIFGALALGLAGIFYTFYMKDMLDERTALRTDVAKLEAEVAKGGEIMSQLQKFKTELADLEARLKKLREILPSQKETPQLLRSTQEMAAHSNLKIMKFLPQPVIPRAFYSDWPIQLEVKGCYSSLGTFFEKVSQTARILNVENISIRTIENSLDQANTLTAVCAVTTYVFREEMAAEAAKQEPKR